METDEALRRLRLAQGALARAERYIHEGGLYSLENGHQSIVYAVQEAEVVASTYESFAKFIHHVKEESPSP